MAKGSPGAGHALAADTRVKGLMRTVARPPAKSRDALYVAPIDADAQVAAELAGSQVKSGLTAGTADLIVLGAPGDHALR